MHIILNNTSMIPIYEQLVSGVKAEILSGELKENEPLPSVRALSAELRISALTVKKAYDFLEKEGFIITVHGKGSYVAPTNLALAMEARRKAVEDDFMKAIQNARAAQMAEEEIREIVDILLEENHD